MENTFRPPDFHRNIMSEFMGLITGTYDAKLDGFVPGGASIHNRMSAHGPDANSCIVAQHKALKPEFLADTMAFMLESSQIWTPTEFALHTHALQNNYQNCWHDIPVLFNN
jgi:homogentisate 1,2-dioxygenase